MRYKYEHLITGVEHGSIANELEVEPGDTLLSINGKQVRDIFDYLMLCEDTDLEVLIRKKNGEEWLLDIEKDEDLSLGLTFENGLMDNYRSCRNKCIFCFIDQLPSGMRPSLYFKDDDSRLSCLQGNYITLTNMDREDIDRIIRLHLSPVNISVHTTDPALRCMMLNNRFAGDSLKYIETLAGAGIEMNAQIVLCKGVNDKDNLTKTVFDLSEYIPDMRSVSVVPAGLTKYRRNLYPLSQFTPAESEEVIDRTEELQEKFIDLYGTRFVYASDEFYINAGRELPPDENYDGYPQLENGVGMMRLFSDEAEETLRNLSGDGRCHAVSFISGSLAFPFLKELSEKVTEKFPRVTIYAYEIKNHFFGEGISVSGLLTGSDIIAQLKGKPLGSRLLIPANALKNGEAVFLDDVTPSRLENDLQIHTDIVKSNGNAFIKALLAEPYNQRPDAGGLHQPYEL